MKVVILTSVLLLSFAANAFDYGVELTRMDARRFVEPRAFFALDQMYQPKVLIRWLDRLMCSGHGPLPRQCYVHQVVPVRGLHLNGRTLVMHKHGQRPVVCGHYRPGPSRIFRPTGLCTFRYRQRMGFTHVYLHIRTRHEEDLI